MGKKVRIGRMETRKEENGGYREKKTKILGRREEVKSKVKIEKGKKSRRDKVMDGEKQGENT